MLGMKTRVLGDSSHRLCPAVTGLSQRERGRILAAQAVVAWADCKLQ